MSLLDRDAANLIFSLYAYDNSPNIDWDYQDSGGKDSFPWGGLWDLAEPGCLNCIFAGTETVNEGFRDVDAFPIYIDLLDDWVHSGFWRGVPEVLTQIALLKPERIRITGHSYGAAHGRLVSKALAALGTIPFSPPVLFGEPSSAFEPSPGRSYGIVGDPICRISPYPHASQIIWLYQNPTSDDPLCRHHIQLYQKALQNIDTSTP